MSIVGHRGACVLHLPENSIESAAYALNSGIDTIEVDVRFTKDRKVVVFHDETLDRVLEHASGYVNEISLEDLKKYKFKNSKSGIPTLEEMLYFVKSRGKKILIELKTDFCFKNSFQLPKVVAKIVKDMEMEKSVVILSFDCVALYVSKLYFPELMTCFLYEKDYPTFLLNVIIGCISAEIIGPSCSLVSISLIEYWKQKDILVYVWVIRDNTMKEFLKFHNCWIAVDDN